MNSNIEREKISQLIESYPQAFGSIALAFHGLDDSENGWMDSDLGVFVVVPSANTSDDIGDLIANQEHLIIWGASKSYLLLSGCTPVGDKFPNFAPIESPARFLREVQVEPIDLNELIVLLYVVEMRPIEVELEALLRLYEIILMSHFSEQDLNYIWDNKYIGLGSVSLAKVGRNAINEVFLDTSLGVFQLVQNGHTRHEYSTLPSEDKRFVVWLDAENPPLSNVRMHKTIYRPQHDSLRYLPDYL